MRQHAPRGNGSTLDMTASRSCVAVWIACSIMAMVTLQVRRLVRAPYARDDTLPGRNTGPASGKRDATIFPHGPV